MLAKGSALSLSLGFLLLPMFGTTQTIQSTVCNPMAAPAIVLPVDAASLVAGQVSISGTADAGLTVSILLDTTTVLQETSSDSGTFAGSIPITAGSHQLSVSLTDACSTKLGNSIAIVTKNPPSPVVTPSDTNTTTNASSEQQTQTTSSNSSSQSNITTTTSGDGLRITVNNVVNKRVITGDSITVAGTLSENGTVSVYRGDELLAASNIESLEFSFQIPLNKGSNTLRIMSTTKTGKHAVLSMEITREAKDPADSSSGVQKTSSSRIQRYSAASVCLAAALLVLGWLVLAVRRRKQHTENATAAPSLIYPVGKDRDDS